jgi:hypothetical protein
MMLCQRVANGDPVQGGRPAFARSKCLILTILCTLVSPGIGITMTNSCEAHLALPNARFSLQKVFEPAVT